MGELVVVVVEDEPEVRAAVLRDLREFSGPIRIEAAADSDEAEEVIDEAGARNDRVGLVLCDHLLPGRRGTDFLVVLQGREDTASAKKVLITGQASHEDTIRAVNEAGLDHYIAKPWAPERLQAVVRRLLTDFVVEHGENLLRYVPVLEGERLIAAAGGRTWDH
jgi:two-component system chemotaxis response regulator CheY